PKAGSLGIVLLLGMGFFGGGVANAVIGEIADSYLPDALDEQATVQVLEQVEQEFPEYVEMAEEAAGNTEALAALGYREAEVRNVLERSEEALSHYQENGEFAGNLTGNALRALIDSGLEQEQELIDQANTVLAPADNYGGRMAFLWVSPLAFFTGIVFIIWFIRDKRRGGYKIQTLE
ncbi:MAG: hypothetical protein GVY07_12240, partial [Bacteroidetes bacterium]|nr:hypothetical protein [Bacteroidota bacterium]